MGEVQVEFVGELTGAHGFQSQGLGRYVILLEIGTGQTLRDILAKLAAEHGAFAKAVFHPETQRLRSSIIVVINDRVAEAMGGLDTELSENDRILLLSVLAGG